MYHYYYNSILGCMPIWQVVDADLKDAYHQVVTALRQANAHAAPIVTANITKHNNTLLLFYIKV